MSSGTTQDTTSWNRSGHPACGQTLSQRDSIANPSQFSTRNNFTLGLICRLTMNKRIFIHEPLGKNSSIDALAELLGRLWVNPLSRLIVGDRTEVILGVLITFGTYESLRVLCPLIIPSRLYCSPGLDAISEDVGDGRLVS